MRQRQRDNVYRPPNYPQFKRVYIVSRRAVGAGDITDISEGAMRTEDWNELDIWLDDFETDELLPYKELISEFEKAHGKQIRWVNNES